MIDDNQIIEYPIPADLWQDYVDGFIESSGTKPDLSNPDVAIFKISDTIYLHVIKAERTLVPTTDSLCALVGSPKLVEIIADGLKLKNFRNIRVVGIVNKQPVDYTITMATTKIPKRSASGSDDPAQNPTDTSSDVSSTDEPIVNTAIQLEGGVIHNPPQATLMQQSGTTEITDDK